MKIAILGTRGIPNHYGGFEQFAEYLSLGLAQAGFDVSVYNSHDHPYQKSLWNGVRIIHCYDAETKLGTVGQFVYDLNCIMDSRKRNFDIILQLGYTSNSIWSRLLPRKSIITTNMDGLEWKRSKYSKNVQQFLQYAESLAVKHSHHLISDSVGIKAYLKDKYNAESTFIPYGAHVFNTPAEDSLQEYNLTPFNYDLLIARLEPENSIEIILDGVCKSQIKRPFLVIGKHETKFGNLMKEKYKDHPDIRFMGGIYNIEKLNNIRYYSNLYFHGHTVGGTNPSLLEAMASNALICAHDNIFNKSILGLDAFYFTSVDAVAKLISSAKKCAGNNMLKIGNNLNKITATYAWPIITEQYIRHFKAILGR